MIEPEHPKSLLLILVAVFLLSALPAGAGKRKEKKHEDTVLTIPEPDPVSRRAKPDSHPRALAYPTISGLGGSSSLPHIHGIDVSHYQGSIDWRRVAGNRDVNYVYIKASEGANIVDDYYVTNVREARRAGLKVGSYHFFRANASADAQFRNFMQTVNVRQQDLIPIIDVETTNGVSEATFHSRLQELLRLVTREFGKAPLIYTGRNFYNKHFHGGRYRDYKFMIASYSFDEPSLNDNDDYIIWQYSASGRISGIRGNVDRSRFVGRHGMPEIIL